MAEQDDLPPSLRHPDSLPPSMRTDDQLPPSLRTQSKLQSAAEASGLPERGLKGIGVGVERLFTGKEPTLKGRAEGALERASEATKPDYKPQPGEKIGAGVAEFADPRFLALGEMGSAMATAPLMKSVFAGATALGGQQVIEDLAKRGTVNPKQEGIAAVEGAAGGAALHGLVKGISKAGGSFVDWLFKPVDKIDIEGNPHFETQPEDQSRQYQEYLKKKQMLNRHVEDSPSLTEEGYVNKSQLEDKTKEFAKTLKTEEPAPKIITNSSKEPPPKIEQTGNYQSLTSKEIDLRQKLAQGYPLTSSEIQHLSNILEPQELMSEIQDHASQGKTISEISNDTGLDKKIVQQAINLSPPIETTSLKVQDAAASGEPAAQLNMLQKAWQYWIASPTEASSTAKNLFRRRYGEIGVGYFDSRLFIRDATGHLTDVEKQALPFIIEGKLPNPEKFIHLQSSDILDTAQRYMQNPNDPNFKNLKYAHEKIGPYLDEGHAFLKDHFDEMGYHENYINHLWERNPKTSTYGPGATSLSQKNPFTKARTIGSYAEGIDAGYTPKTLDVSELLKAYDNYKIKTVANMRFRDGLENVLVEGGRKAILPIKDAPADWKYVDSPFFTGTKVSPEVFDAVRAIVDKPFAFTEPGPNAPLSQKAFHSIINGYEYLNAVTKKVRLSMSFFHHFSLTETALGGGTNPLKVLKDQASNIYKGAEWDGIRDLPGALYKSFMEGHANFQNIPLARDAVEHGLQVGSVGDVHRGKIVKLLTEVEDGLNKRIPLAGKAVKGIKTFNDIWDMSLWDYYHAGIKLQMYEDHLAENIKKFGETMPAEQIKQQTADFVNKATGGALESMMYSPKYRQALQWAFLAPDWTLTRLQTAASVFKGGPEGLQGRKFWLRAGTAFYTMANTLNYVNTQKYLGKGRFIWENDPGKEWHVFLKKDDNGRNVYIMPAKTLVEVVGWFQHPLQTLGAKAAPGIQMMAEVLQHGDRTLSGFNIPEDQRGAGQFLKRNLTPFSMSNNNVAMTFPMSKGISKTQVIQMMQDGIEKGDTKSLQKAIKFGIENGYDVSMLRNMALRNVKTKMKKALVQ